MLPAPASAPPASPLADGLPPGALEAMRRVLAGQPSRPATVPGLYDDDKALIKFHNEAREECFNQERQAHERIWWRNLLYVLGRQWIFYHARRGWIDKRMARWIPRPVTNKMLEATEAIQSVLGSVQLANSVSPVGNKPKAIATATLVDQLEPFLYQDHDMDDVMVEHDFWFIVTGNAFLHPHWDKSGDGPTVMIPFERCDACGQVSPPDEIVAANDTCPKCASPLLQEEDGERGTFGRGRTAAPSPFEMAFPSGFTEWRDLPMVGRTRWRPKRWLQRNLPAEFVAKLMFDKSPAERTLQMVRAIASQTDVTTLPQGFGAWATSLSDEEGLSEYEWWVKPCGDYPEGLFLRVLGDQTPVLLREPSESTPGPLPYPTAKGGRLFPFTHSCYFKIGGRILGVGPLDRAIQKQDQLNQLDANVQLATQRMSNPVWLEPDGADVKHLTGEPGLVVRYKPLVAGLNSKPERIPGEAPQAGVMALREQYIADIEDLTGTHDVIKGTKPTGVEAFSALQLLVERSQSRFTLPLKRRGKAYRDCFKMQLELEREYGPDERVQAVLGPNRAYVFKEFKRASIQDEVEIHVEDGSTAPKTNLGRRASTEHLNQLGFLDPNDPDQRAAILKDFGMESLAPALSANLQAALREQHDFEEFAATYQPMPPPVPIQGAGGLPPNNNNNNNGIGIEQNAPALGPAEGPPAAPPAPGAASLQAPAIAPAPIATPFQRKLYHNDLAHIVEHRKWAQGDAAQQIFQQWPELEFAFCLHLMEHEQAEGERQQAEAMLATPGGGKQAAGASRSMRQSNQESGNPNDVPKGHSEAAHNRGPE